MCETCVQICVKIMCKLCVKCAKICAWAIYVWMKITCGGDIQVWKTYRDSLVGKPTCGGDEPPK